jgi:hypothetical protein
MNRPFYRKKRYLIPFTALLLLIILLGLFRYTVILNPPIIIDFTSSQLQRITLEKNVYQLNDSWLKKNEYGLWEMYVTGNDFELGVKNGILAKELIDYQEEAFVDQIKKMIPSEFYLNFLKYFIAWFNKDIDKHIPIAYQKEIYGISLNANNYYSFIAPNYQRMLNYHAAHDIGHTLQNMNLVACTAFGVNNKRSADGSLLIGRNMDFYSGDKFAENKIVSFVKPEKGYSFVSITWGGLIGVISGMNSKGLTVTLNAAESSIPTSAKTPVSILAREILQHASTINEAYQIATKYETFVAESFLIASAIDKQMAVIEKSVEKTELYRGTDEEIIVTNHFQSEPFIKTELNINNRKDGCSVYRWERTEEILHEQASHTPASFAAILRDQQGKGNTNIGMGNEKAINQLIAHHSVIFKPQQLQIWVSASNYQLGEYVMYDLNRIFSDTLNFRNKIYEPEFTIPADSFIYSIAYQNFIKYKEYTSILKKIRTKDKIEPLDQYFIEEYKNLNPQYYYTYFELGEYYAALNQNEKALEYYNSALKLEVPRLTEIQLIEGRIDAVNQK